MVAFDKALAIDTYIAAHLDTLGRHQAAIRELSTPVIKLLIVLFSAGLRTRARLDDRPRTRIRYGPSTAVRGAVSIGSVMRRSRAGGALLLGAVVACSRQEDRRPTEVTTTPTATLPETTASVVPSASAPPVVVVPDVDALPWETGEAIGAGIARKDTGNLVGDNVLVAWAGWRVSLSSAEAWATALYRASFETRGVRWIFAVQGPKDPLYRQREIGTEKLAMALVSTMSARTKFVAGVAHSSGAYVANELFARLAHGGDPLDTTRGRIVYFDLDGGEAGLDAQIVERLRRAYFVGAYDATIATASHEDDDMRAAGASYVAAGGYVRHVADGSGCNRGATWCLHMTLVTTRPHDPRDAKEIDFTDFVGREVAHAFIDAKATEAGLVH